MPGDLVLLEGGDIVPAEIGVTNASKLQANESALTGESMPLDRTIKPVKTETVLAERTNMRCQNTGVVRGSGRAVVTSTGMSTELGNKLIWVVLVIVGVSATAGVLAGRDLLLTTETEIALLVFRNDQAATGSGCDQVRPSPRTSLAPHSHAGNLCPARNRCTIAGMSSGGRRDFVGGDV